MTCVQSSHVLCWMVVLQPPGQCCCPMPVPTIGNSHSSPIPTPLWFLFLSRWCNVDPRGGPAAVSLLLTSLVKGTGDKHGCWAELCHPAVLLSAVCANDFPAQQHLLFPSQMFCITVYIVDSVLSLSLSDMTPGSFVCSGRLTGVDFCAAILHLVLTSVSDIFINFYQD